MKSKTNKVTCFGEVLWDIFPTHKKIGGAPLNVALRLKSFGVDVSLISRIGNDDNGKKIAQFISKNGLDTATIQIDNEYKTGRVNVTLDDTGSATYEIEYPVAWDKIKADTISVEKVKAAEAFIFGSLACRDAITKNSLLKLLGYANYKIFDVNLRPPFYTLELLIELMKKTDFVKLNDEELDEICEKLDFVSDSNYDKINFLADYTNTKHICVTQGKNGAVLFYDGIFYSNEGYKVKVADTVGAGDSFLATLIYNLLSGKNPDEALNFACAIGAMVAGKEGANPKISTSEIIDFMK